MADAKLITPGMADSLLASPLRIGDGLTMPNRLVKAAMAEGMGGAATKYMPGPKVLSLYKHFAEGDWGMVLTGNVQVDVRHLGGPGDMAYDTSISEAELIEKWRTWADLYKDHQTPLVMQINHPGRQSMAGQGEKSFWTKSLAPSAVPLRLGRGFFAWAASAVGFGTPKAMTQQDIDEVTELFRGTARAAYKAGFAGVELHGAHGYLLAQFLSAKSNHRTDAYGGTPAKRAKFVVDIIRAVREATSPAFCVGIKLNSVDYQDEEALAGCIEQLKLIHAAGIDFLEISGGDYEDPMMMKGGDAAPVEKSARTKAREAYFLEFAKAIRSTFSSLPLLVTGGFRTRQGMEAALAGGGCDMVGIARPAALDPKVPKTVIFNPDVSDEEAVFNRKVLAAPWLLRAMGLGTPIGAGAQTTWHVTQMKKYVSEH